MMEVDCLDVFLACESPIEEMLFDAIILQIGDYDSDLLLGVEAYGKPRTELPAILSSPCKYQWRLWVQPIIGHRRADMLLELEANAKRVLSVIECDGHHFHERTKAQAAKDRRFDRFCQELGLGIFRFTGSEIFQDADACARQVATFVYRNAWGDPWEN